MPDKIRITADQVISRSKGVKYYAADGSIKTAKAKEVQIIEPGDEQVAPEDSRRDFEHEDDASAQAEAPVSNDAQEAEPAQAAAPASSTKRGKGKKGAEMATKKKGGAKKKAAAKGIRTIGGREHDISGYEKVKNASGHFSYDNGDDTATKLRGKTLDEVYEFAAKKLGETVKALKAKYAHLNPGMQRMSLGNRLRKGSQAKAA